MFDVVTLCCLPNMVVMAAGDEAELVHMVHTAAQHDTSPIAFRYPRGEGVGIALPVVPESLPIGRGRIIDAPANATIALFSFGARLSVCRAACDARRVEGIAVTLADARFAKPLDTEMLLALVNTHDHVITVEEGVCGGFSSQVLHALTHHAPHRLHVIRPLTLPDMFQPHGLPETMYADAGMDAVAIAALIRGL
jgi:1-deoxy-D-xylulose-5-phosphate synthase